MKSRDGNAYSLDFLIIVIALFSVACDRTSNTDAQKNAALLKGMVQYHFDSTMTIMLPPKYKTTRHEGPDFDVYYFSSSDSTKKKSAYNGGLYFGYAPGLFDSKASKKDVANGRMLARPVKWALAISDTDVFIQTMLNNTDGEKIHVFGHAPTRKAADTLMAIFSTLAIKKTAHK